MKGIILDEMLPPHCDQVTKIFFIPTTEREGSGFVFSSITVWLKDFPCELEIVQTDSPFMVI